MDLFVEGFSKEAGFEDTVKNMDSYKRSKIYGSLERAEKTITDRVTSAAAKYRAKNIIEPVIESIRANDPSGVTNKILEDSGRSGREFRREMAKLNRARGRILKNKAIIINTPLPQTKLKIPRALKYGAVFGVPGGLVGGALMYKKWKAKAGKK